MIVYRIVKNKSRAADLSGTGAYNTGGRWNSEGTYAVYTSENRALAAVELLVHLDESEIPPRLFIMAIEISSNGPIYEVPDKELPDNWRLPESSALKNLGDKLLSGRKYLGLKVHSAIIPYEYNVILNPQYAGFFDLVNILSVEEFELNRRLL